MLQRLSLKSKIILQFLLLAAPILTLVTLQTWLDDRRVNQLEASTHLRTAANTATTHFTAFVNAVVDAVDTGTLRSNSTGEVVGTLQAIEQLNSLEPTPELARLLSDLQSLRGTLAAKPTLDALLPLRSQINGIDKSLKQLVMQYEAANSQVVADGIRDSRKQKWAVGGVTALTLLIASGFVWYMVVSLTRPLEVAVGLAKRIARGELIDDAEIDSRRDIDHLLESLRDMNRQLTQMIRSVLKATDAMGLATQSFAAETGRVIESSQGQDHHVHATIEQVGAMVAALSAVRQSAGEVYDVAQQNSGLGQQGAEQMTRNLQATDAIKVSVDASAQDVHQLATAVVDIGAVTKIIKEIADQTNLLALNAAIEAARAGEQGRGFAVVADEVRKLAERTTQSTADISSRIDNIAAQTQRTVASMAKIHGDVEVGAEFSRSTHTILNRIVESGNQVSQVSHAIEQAADHQEQAGRAVEQAMHRIEQLSQQNIGHARSIESAMRRLHDTADELKRLTGQFRVQATRP